MHKVITGLLLVLVVCYSGCITDPSNFDNECSGEDDFILHEYVQGIRFLTINQQTYVGNSYFPNGFIYDIPSGVSKINEVYHLIRVDDFGYPIHFLWDRFTPPPFQFNPPFRHLRPLEIGETVNVWKAVENIGEIDLDCIGASSVKNQVQVKVEDGQIVSTRTYEQSTPRIERGHYQVLSFPVEYTGQGYYNFKFEVNFDNVIPEIDTSNNTYIRRSTDIDS